jgi:hypothetical protein
MEACFLHAQLSGTSQLTLFGNWLPGLVLRDVCELVYSSYLPGGGGRGQPLHLQVRDGMRRPACCIVNLVITLLT